MNSLVHVLYLPTFTSYDFPCGGDAICRVSEGCHGIAEEVGHVSSRPRLSRLFLLPDYSLFLSKRESSLAGQL